MINITDKFDCCGCTACVDKCPVNCISMETDNEGFDYPVVNKEICIHCDICIKVCPELNESIEKKPLKTYAAKNRDEIIRKESSSGGIFTLLSAEVIKKGGVVFGVKFDKKNNIVHSVAKNIDELKAFRGAKYSQSKQKNIFNDILSYLKKGTEVLYAGTPCQVHGLHLFLMKKYDNLTTIDFVCHGVPSPKVLKKYLNEISSKDDVSNIQFRSKSTGWKSYSFECETPTSKFSENVSKNLFLQGFIQDLYLRPACHKCPSKNFKSNSDITLADFWGIENILPDFDDDKGVTLTMLHSSKGISKFHEIKTESIEVSYDDVTKYNPSMTQSVSIPERREIFFQNLDNSKVIPLLNTLVSRHDIKSKIKKHIYKIIYRLKK